MRVAHVLSRFPEPSQTFVAADVSAALRAGHRVEVYASAPGELASLDADLWPCDLIACARLHPPIDFRAGPAPPASALDRVRRNAALARRTRHAFGRRGRAFPWPLHTRLAWCLRRHDFDVVHAQFGYNGRHALWLRDAEVMSGPVVTSFRGADLSRFVQRQGEGVYADLFARGTLFLPVCEHLRGRLLALGCDGDRVRVQRGGVDCRRFAAVSRTRPSGRPVRLVTVGRLVEKKGVEVALRALARLGGDFEYRVAGDGPLRGALEALARRLGIAERVHWLGAQPQAAVRELLVAADALLAPSHTGSDGDEEGIPNALKEAMATALPVVSTRHAGIPELVEDGVSGLLATPGDVDALADALERLLARSARWTAMGRAGRARVERAYDLARQQRLLLERYAEAAALARS